MKNNSIMYQSEIFFSVSVLFMHFVKDENVESRRFDLGGIWNNKQLSSMESSSQAAPTHLPKSGKS